MRQRLLSVRECIHPNQPVTSKNDHYYHCFMNILQTNVLHHPPQKAQCSVLREISFKCVTKDDILFT